MLTITIGAQTPNAENPAEFDIPVTYTNTVTGKTYNDVYTMAPSYKNLLNQIELNLASHQDVDDFLNIPQGAFTIPS